MRKLLMILLPGICLFLTGCAGTVKEDVEALKQGQEALRKDIAEIRKQLQERPASPKTTAQMLDKELEIGDAPLKGDKNARVTIMEFSDYQCPFCRRHAVNTLPHIDKEYIATGKVRYIFRDFPLESIHKYAQKAAEAAHCAGEQGKYWEMHDKLFDNQKALSSENFTKYAKSIGLKTSSFKKCLDSGKFAETVNKNLTEGQQLGISGTPTLLLGISDGDKFKNIKLTRGAQPFAVFKQEIDALLEGKPEEKK